MADKRQEFSLTEGAFQHAQVEVYPYRTAYVTEPFLTLPRNMMREFEDKLVEKAGQHNRSNHVVYEVTLDLGMTYEQKVYIWCHDFVMMFGWGMHET